jgi:hypothetical protein
MSASEGAAESGPVLPRAPGAPPATDKWRDPRTHVLLDSPITPTLLRLAAPNVLVMVAQGALYRTEDFKEGRSAEAENRPPIYQGK